MDLTEYPAAELKALASATARGSGGRLVRWSVTVSERSGAEKDVVELRVYYKPRHWRHCPACQGGDLVPKGAHVGPKGEPVKELETATVAL